MKKLHFFFGLIFVLATLSLRAQVIATTVVIDSFTLKYPNSQQVEWKNRITHYEAKFVFQNVEMTANFTAQGKWQESGTIMTFSALPTVVKTGFSGSSYNSWTPGTATKLERKDGSVKYRIFVEKAGVFEKMFLTFSCFGILEKDSHTI